MSLPRRTVKKRVYLFLAYDIQTLCLGNFNNITISISKYKEYPKTFSVRVKGTVIDIILFEKLITEKMQIFQI